MNVKEIERLQEEIFNSDFIKPIKNKEAQTITSLIEPFLRALGYDTQSPKCYGREVTAGSRKQDNDRIDCVIYKDEKPLILIEAKAYGENLDKEKFKQQIEWYFTATESSTIVLLTDGVEYRFFSNFERNRLDSEPFFVFDLKNHSEADLAKLEDFSYNTIDLEKIRKWGKENKVYQKVFDKLCEEIKSPSDELAECFAKALKDSFGIKQVHQSVKDKCKKYLKKAFGELYQLQDKPDETISSDNQDAKNFIALSIPERKELIRKIVKEEIGKAEFSKRDILERRQGFEEIWYLIGNVLEMKDFAERTGKKGKYGAVLYRLK
ncbi:type I restriction endonuclease [Helicobacter sp. 11S02596-1]|uniref:type I restriction endonuclease n=1 Tax=Helicobacter sp. 11S02596-1 TaxID=1476194 RepID=UPI000BA5573F|nr:type I restriction endonuclease [Helicobacter sp. 11S02596-1]PAF44722.1 hypothetical protein BJI48_01660 [Helicobacter sp. 11S02596-1]